MFSVCEESPGVVSYILTIFSLLLVLVTLPFSLLYTVKVVQVSFIVLKFSATVGRSGLHIFPSE